MRFYSLLVCVGLIAGAFSCNSIQPDAAEVGGASDLATLNYQSNLGLTDVYYAYLGGKDQNCPKFRDKNCEAALALVKNNIFTITPIGANAANCTPTIRLVNVNGAQPITVKNGCSYKFESAYHGGDPQQQAPSEFILQGAQEAAIQAGQTTFEVKLALKPTEAGIRNGLPPVGVVAQDGNGNNGNATGTVDVTIDNNGLPTVTASMQDVYEELKAAGNNDELVRNIKLKYEKKNVKWIGLVTHKDLKDTWVGNNRYFLTVYHPTLVARLNQILKADPNVINRGLMGASYNFSPIVSVSLHPNSYTINNMPNIEIGSKVVFTGVIDWITYTPGTNSGQFGISKGKIERTP